MSRLAALDLDRAEIQRTEPAVLSDLQRVCTMCTSGRECKRDLAEAPTIRSGASIARTWSRSMPWLPNARRAAAGDAQGEGALIRRQPTLDGQRSRSSPHAGGRLRRLRHNRPPLNEG